jgi:hypothetical protein
MPYRYAQELALFVRQPQGLARPALRIAGDLRIGKVSDNCQRLCAGGRSVRQLDPFLVRHDAMAEAEVEKKSGMTLLPFNEEDARLCSVPQSGSRQT